MCWAAPIRCAIFSGQRVASRGAMTEREALPDYDQAILRIIAKWRKVVARTKPIDRDGAESALSKLYQYLGRNAPVAFAFYKSPEAALEDFERWRDQTGSVANVIWQCSVPLCDREGAFRYWRAPTADIALWRGDRARPRMHYFSLKGVCARGALRLAPNRCHSPRLRRD